MMTTGALGTRHQNIMVWCLGLTQIVGYGTLYYAYAILAPDIAASFGWRVSSIFGAFSISLIAGGLVAPYAGRLMDRRDLGPLMAMGSVAAAITLVAMAFAPNLYIFTFLLTLMQIAASVVHYDAAFVTLSQNCGHRASDRIVHLTLLAGFASTLFWPLTEWLQATLDWRQIFLVFAVMNLLICAPLHWYVKIKITPHANLDDAPPKQQALHEVLPDALQGKVFALIAIGFALSSFALSGFLAQLVPVLKTLGFGASALFVAAIFGPAQVVVRLVNLIFGQNRHPMVITLFSTALMLIAVVVLWLGAPVFAAGVLFAALMGAFSGLKSVVQGTLPLVYFGRLGYGARLGKLSAYRFLLAAIAPFVLSWLLDVTGPNSALLFMIATTALSLAAFIAADLLIKHQA